MRHCENGEVVKMRLLPNGEVTATERLKLKWQHNTIKYIYTYGVKLPHCAKEKTWSATAGDSSLVVRKPKCKNTLTLVKWTWQNIDSCQWWENLKLIQNVTKIGYLH